MDGWMNGFTRCKRVVAQSTRLVLRCETLNIHFKIRLGEIGNFPFKESSNVLSFAFARIKPRMMSGRLFRCSCATIFAALLILCALSKTGFSTNIKEKVHRKFTPADKTNSGRRRYETIFYKYVHQIISNFLFWQSLDANYMTLSSHNVT